MNEEKQSYFLGFVTNDKLRSALLVYLQTEYDVQMMQCRNSGGEYYLKGICTPTTFETRVSISFRSYYDGWYAAKGVK
jgi:hypothetical protein